MPWISALAIGAVATMAAIAPCGYRRWPRATSIAVVLVSGTAFALFALQVPQVADGRSLLYSFEWVPSFGARIAFRVDGLALVFALLITGIGSLILAYAPAYCGHERTTGRLLGLLLAFEASMLGLVTADDTMTFFVFWELTSFTSFFLISLDGTAERARVRARQALVVTAAGGLVLLVGLLLLADAQPGAGLSISFSALADADVRSHPHYSVIVVLIAIGAFTKSAQVPFHFWLPGAMVATTPVSAYLHSATMVKAGVYILARLYPDLGGTALWTWLLVPVGAVTFLTGSLLAVVQRDVKLTLAYATVAVLGALTLSLGIGTTAAIGGALVLLVAHAFYKAALFLATGNLDHHRGTRDPFAPPGTVRDMPVTAATAALACASMAGVPPLLGFIAKDGLYAATLGGPVSVAITSVSFVAGAAFVTSAWIAGVAPYLRGKGRWTSDDVPRALLVGPAILAVAGVVFGIAPQLLEQWVITPAATAIAGRTVNYDVALWHGATGTAGLAFWLGLGSILVGSAGAYVVWRRREAISTWRQGARMLSGDRAHEALLDGILNGARRFTRAIQHGHLPSYVGILIAVVVVFVAIALRGEVDVLGGNDLRAGPYEVALLCIAAASVVLAAVFRDRLSSVAALSIAGLMVTFLFALFSGPDLAITQLTVETMMLILLVLLLRRLGPSSARERQTGRGTRLVVATASGVLVSVLLVVATSTSGFERTAATEQVRLAPEEHFENVVNAILVNFRALDTLGEITVIAIAALGVAALARGREELG